MKLRNLFEARAQSVGIIFGRFNPPHKGHRKAWEMASENDAWYVGTNQSTQGPKDPLPYGVKIEAMRMVYPDIEGHIMPEQSWLTMASRIYEKYGDILLRIYTDEEWVVKTIVQYNGKEGPHGFYNFKNIDPVGTPRLSSATELRNAVSADDRAAFSQAAGIDADTPLGKNSFFDVVKHYLTQQTAKPAKKEKAMKVKEYKGATDQERINAFKQQAKDMRDKGFVRAADDTEKVAKTIYKPKEKVKAKADEGRFGRNRDDQFSLGGRMPRTDRIDRDSSSGQDAQQRMERKMKLQTIDRLLDRHPDWERSDLELASLPELIQMLREGIPYSYGFVTGRKKPNATTRHLRDYPVSDKDVAKPVKKPEKKKPEQGVAEGSLETDNMVSHIGQVIQSIYPRGGDKKTYMKLVAQEMPRIVKANPKLFRRAFGMAYDRFFHIDQDDDFDYTDHSMRQGERGLEEGSLDLDEAKDTKVPQKPRQGPLRPQTGAGRHQDKKKDMKQGKEKHKKPLAEAIMDSMLSELDRPSGKLYIVIKGDPTGAVRMFGAFANSPEEVEFIAQRRGTKDKSGAKMKGLKVDLMFLDAADAMMDLKRIFKDIDFVGAEAAEFVFKNSAMNNDEVDPRVQEELKDFMEYVESGDDPRMAIYQEKEVGNEPDRVAKGVDHFVVGPDGKRRRVPIPGKPNSQMGGHAVEQPDTYKYVLKQPNLANALRGMGFNFDGNKIIIPQDKRKMLQAKFAAKNIPWDSVFGAKEVFKESR